MVHSTLSGNTSPIDYRVIPGLTNTRSAYRDTKNLAHILGAQEKLPLLGRMQAKVGKKGRLQLPNDLLTYITTYADILHIQGSPLYSFTKGDQTGEIIMQVSFSVQPHKEGLHEAHSRNRVYIPQELLENDLLTITNTTTNPFVFHISPGNKEFTPSPYRPAGLLSQPSVNNFILEDWISYLFPLDHIYHGKEGKGIPLDDKNRITLPSLFDKNIKKLGELYGIKDIDYKLFLHPGSDKSICIETNLSYDGENSPYYYLVDLHNKKFCLPGALKDHLGSPTHIRIKRDATVSLGFIIESI